MYLLFLLSVVVFAQGVESWAQISSDTTQFRTESKQVFVDVVVRTRSGEPVRKLSAEDFEVFENGVLQRLDAVQEFSGTFVSDANHKGFQFTNFRTPDSEVTSSLIILVDFLNTPSEHRPRLRTALTEFLTRFGAKQPIAIYSLGSDVHRLQDFTEDTRLLLFVASRMDSQVRDPKGSRTAAADLKQLSKMLSDPMLEQMAEALKFDENYELTSVKDRATATLDAFRLIGQHSRERRGRKSLVWISGGFPLFATNARGDVSSEGATEAVSRALSDAQVAVYPLDVEGLPGFRAGQPITEAPQMRDARGRLIAGVAAAEQIQRNMARPEANYDTMARVAALTGGVFTKNRNDLDAVIESAAQDNRDYYALFYRPASDKAGFRKLEVRVKREGLRVRHRQGYFAGGRGPAPSEPGNASAPSHKPILLFADLEHLPEKKGRLAIRVSGESLMFSGENNQRRASLSYAFATADKKGRILHQDSAKASLSLTEAQLKEALASGLAFTVEFPLTSASELLLLTVTDDSSKRSGRLTVPLR